MINNENTAEKSVHVRKYDRGLICERRRLEAMRAVLMKIMSDIDYLSMMADIELEDGEASDE